MRKSGDKGGVEAFLGSTIGWNTRDFKPNFSSIHLQAQIKIITLPCMGVSQQQNDKRKH